MTDRSREACLIRAEALDAAVHLLDDDESAEVIATLADGWRAEAELATPSPPIGSR